MVRDGIVEFKSNELKKSILIEKGHLGRLNRESMDLEKEVVDDMDFFTGWLEGRLIFKNSPFSEVLSQIRRWFNVDITLELTDDRLLEKEFTADLKMRSVDNVFEVMAVSLNFDYTMTNEDQIVIKN